MVMLLWYNQRLNSRGTLLESLHFRLCRTLRGQISPCLDQVHLQLEGNIKQICLPCASYKSARLHTVMLCWVGLPGPEESSVNILLQHWGVRLDEGSCCLSQERGIIISVTLYIQQWRYEVFCKENKEFCTLSIIWNNHTLTCRWNSTASVSKANQND